MFKYSDKNESKNKCAHSPQYLYFCQRWRDDVFKAKNTIRDGGNTALYAAYTVDTVDAVYTVDTVDMV